MRRLDIVAASILAAICIVTLGAIWTAEYSPEEKARRHREHMEMMEHRKHIPIGIVACGGERLRVKFNIHRYESHGILGKVSYLYLYERLPSHSRLVKKLPGHCIVLEQ